MSSISIKHLNDCMRHISRRMIFLYFCTLIQTQLRCRDKVFSPEDGMGACSHDPSGSASAIFIPVSTQCAGLDVLEEQHCNGSLKKQPISVSGDDCDSQRYSADPTVFFGERGPKSTNEDGYMSPMNKSASGKSKNIWCLCIQNPLGSKIWGGMCKTLLGINELVWCKSPLKVFYYTFSSQ